MDEHLIKILNKATSDSYQESNVAIDHAYQYMKKADLNIDDINFDSLYNGDVVAIKLITRFSDELKNNNDKSKYINKWTKKLYSINEHYHYSEEILLSKDIEIASLKNKLKRQKNYSLKNRQNHNVHSSRSLDAEIQEFSNQCDAAIKRVRKKTRESMKYS
jgi:hypothetical protein